MGNGFILPKYVSAVISSLEGAGFSAYAVGGCVRDSIMGRTPQDWDVATSAPGETVENIFKKTIPTGIKYGTVTVLDFGKPVEVTTFRRDGEYTDGRKPDKVEFVSDITEDQSRRDFTIKAMALGLDGRVIDPFEGGLDVLKGRIRCVGIPEKRFSEDALRMLRAIRFSSVLGFSIENNTLTALRDMAPMTRCLSAERVSGELGKILMSDGAAMAGKAISWGLLEGYVRQGDIDLHGLNELPRELTTRWCAFAWAASRAGLTDGHPRLLLRKLRLSGKAVGAMESAEAVASELPMELDALRLKIAEYGVEKVLLAAYCRGMEGEKCLEQIRQAMEIGEIISVEKLSVSGYDLLNIGIKGGLIGQVLKILSQEATLGETKNTREALLRRAAELLKEQEVFCK